LVDAGGRVAGQGLRPDEAGNDSIGAWRGACGS
jgi:hypothetical protein